MKIWIDDVRPAPDGYVWCKSVKETINTISSQMWGSNKIELIDLDHDSGDYFADGGDYIKILDWLERQQRQFGRKINFSFHIHSMNPVGIENMMRIINKNKWRYV